MDKRISISQQVLEQGFRTVVPHFRLLQKLHTTIGQHLIGCLSVPGVQNASGVFPYKIWEPRREQKFHVLLLTMGGSRMIFREILDELTVASPHARPRLPHAMRNAILHYLTPVLTESKAGPYS